MSSVVDVFTDSLERCWNLLGIIEGELEAYPDRPTTEDWDGFNEAMQLAAELDSIVTRLMG